MQVALFAVLADSSVIVHAVSHIGILLDLGDQDALADRVERSGLDKENISLLYRHCVEYVEKRVLLDPAGKLFPGDLFFETVVQECAFLRVEDVPHLCFAILALVLQRKSVAGMDLNGQIVPGVNELGQNRELAESTAVRAERLHSHCVQILLQRFARIGSVHDHRRPVRVAGELPRLRQNFAVILHVVLIHQPVAAPQVILAGRFQF